MEFQVKVDPKIVTYVDNIPTPVWVYDIDVDKVLYHNPACNYFAKSRNISEENFHKIEKKLVKKIKTLYKDENYGVLDLISDFEDLKIHFQVILSRINSSTFILHFSEREQSSKYRDLNMMVFFCQLDGRVVGNDNKIEIEHFRNVKEIIDSTHHKKFTNALDKIGKGSKYELLSNIKGHKSLFSRPLEVEFISSFKSEAEVVVLVSEVSYEKELEMEKNRVKFVEEINKKLKSEIAEHKKTQQKLVDSEMLSNIIINSSINMILTFDKDQNITEFNRKAEEISGYTRQEILGKKIGTVLKNEESIKSIEEAVKKEGYYEGELFCRKKDGTQCISFASVSPLKNNKNENIGYVCNLRDISEIDLWRQKLANIEERYFDLFENSTDLIQGVDLNGKFIFTNKTWYKLLGYTIRDREKLTIHDIIIPEEREDFLFHFEKIINGKHNDSNPKIWTLLKKNGDFVIVESIDHLKRKSGKGVSVRSIMRDISDAEEAKSLAQKHYARIEAISESGDILFWTVNNEGLVTSFNSAFENSVYNIYGFKPEKNKMYDYSKSKDSVIGEYLSFWTAKYEKVFATGKSSFFQTKIKDLKNRINYKDVSLRPVRIDDKTGEVLEIACTALDITDRIVSAQKVSEQASKIQTVFDAVNHMIWSVDKKGIITSFNKGFKTRLKERFDMDVEIGDSAKILARFLNLKLDYNWLQLIEHVERVKRLNFEVEGTDINNITFVDDVSLMPIFNEEGEIVELAGLSQNITYKKAAEKKLKDQASKINSIFNSTAMLIWTIDQEHRIVAYNKMFSDEYFRHTRKEISIGDDFFVAMRPLILREDFTVLKEHFDAAFKGENQQFEGTIKNRDGVFNWIEVFLNPIYSEDNIIKEITCLSHDITDKKLIQEQMRENIKEKEILLQEVHHRVKNNLQVISSILNLQSAFVKNPKIIDILRESQNRIKSMSFIHEALYQTKDFSQINFGDYVLSLSTNLVHSYSLTTSGIQLKTDFDELFLLLDQAITCGLIVNELISNALKYAFVEKQNGEVKIIIKEKERIVSLEISDNGIGLPEHIDINNFENIDSLGLQLVHTLVDQLDGEMKVNCTRGTKYLITFEKQ